MNKLRDKMKTTKPPKTFLLLMGMPLIVTFLPFSNFYLDILITLNTVFVIYLLVTACRAKHVGKIMLYPTWILLSIGFSLAIQISSIPVILTKETALQGIFYSLYLRLFGTIDIGTLIANFIIFIVINMMQILLIGRVASRVIDSLLKFNLDRVFLERMIVDASYSSGEITMDQFIEIKGDIDNVNNFKEMLIGSRQFVYSYEKTRLIIIAITIIGGILIGTMIQGHSSIETIETFFPLAIFYGYISMLPPILLSFAIVIFLYKNHYRT